MFIKKSAISQYAVSVLTLVTQGILFSRNGVVSVDAATLYDFAMVKAE
jgi:hypothetical protein